MPLRGGVGGTVTMKTADVTSVAWQQMCVSSWQGLASSPVSGGGWTSRQACWGCFVCLLLLDSVPRTPADRQQVLPDAELKCLVLDFLEPPVLSNKLQNWRFMPSPLGLNTVQAQTYFLELLQDGSLRASFKRTLLSYWGKADFNSTAFTYLLYQQ